MFDSLGSGRPARPREAGGTPALRRLLATCALLVSCGLQKQPQPPPGPLPASAFRVTWERIEAPRILQPGSLKRIIVQVKNSSDTVWPDKQMGDPVNMSGAYAVRLSYRWLDANGDVVADFTERADLPFPILPNQSIEIPISVQAPPHAGSYRLQFDLVQELVGWFAGYGNPHPAAWIQVQEPPAS